MKYWVRCEALTDRKKSSGNLFDGERIRKVISIPSPPSHRIAGRSLLRTLSEGRSAVLWLWSPKWGAGSRLWWSQTQREPLSSGPTSRMASVGSPGGCGLTSTWCWQWTQAPIRSMGKCWGRTTARESLSIRLSTLLLKVGTWSQTPLWKQLL